jgi:heme exporter protein B
MTGGSSGAGRFGVFGVFGVVLGRDLRLAWRRPLEVGLPLAFLVAATALFPLGIGPEPALLRTIAPGVVWTCALLATLLAVPSLLAADLADGTLDQLLLAARGGLGIAVAKAAVHWLTVGLPLVVAGPIVGAAYGLPGPTLAVLACTLALGTPALSLLAALGAALTLGLRGGAPLLVLVLLPLAVPVLVFGAAAVVAFESGVAIGGHLSLLAAASVLALLVGPPASAAALRLAVE